MPDKPVLIVAAGFNGAGKSELARSLCHVLEFRGPVKYVSTDVIRKRLAGIPLTAKLPPAYQTHEFYMRTHRQFRQDIEEAVRSVPVTICDACFIFGSYREMVAKIAEDADADLVGLWIDADINLRRARADSRENDASDVTGANVNSGSSFDPATTEWAKLDGNGTKQQVLRQAIAVLETRGILNPGFIQAEVFTDFGMG